MRTKKTLLTGIVIAMLIMTGCSASDVKNTISDPIGAVSESSFADGEKYVNILEGTGASQDAEEVATTKSSTTEENLSSGNSAASSSTLIDTSSLFTERDLEQEADLTDATYLTLTSGEDITITSEGVYVISGSATNSSIIVNADDSEKVQIVLDGVTISNADAPAIYVKSADKVFVTTTDSENTLKVTGTFSADGTTNTDAVIFSRDDLVCNGVGTLNISSTGNGISCKDDLKITGGTYNITAASDAIEANDSIRIYDGTFTIDAGKDGLHSENSDDTSVGYIYIKGGEFDIDAESDAMQATTMLIIDGGAIDITASEGLEATYVQINDGTINISASDDGINAASKSTSVDVVIEVNGGNITVKMGSGDTDAFDANGSIYINGGTIDITASSAFDFDREAELNGGTVTVNGEEITEITASMMGGGMGGRGMKGGFSGNGGFGTQSGTRMQGGTDASGQNSEAASGQVPGGSGGRMGGNGQMQGGFGPRQGANGQMQGATGSN